MNKHNELYNKGKIKFILGVNQFSDWVYYFVLINFFNILVRKIIFLRPIMNIKII